MAQQNAEQKADNPPEIQLCIATDQGAQLLELSRLESAGGFPANGYLDCQKNPVICYSNRGALVAMSCEKGVNVYTSQGELAYCVPHKHVERIAFSPLDTFLVTADYKQPKKGEEAWDNLNIWNAQNGVLVKSMKQIETKDLSEGKSDCGEVGWSWSSDEKIFTQLVKNQINVFDGSKPDKTIGQLRLPGVTQYVLARSGPPYMFAAHRPAKGDDPARVGIYQYPQLEEKDCVQNKSFFKADEVKMMWSPAGNGLLIQTATASTKDSYYGDTSLYLLVAPATGSGSQWQAFTVPFGTAPGPIEDVQWAPNSREFCAIQGTQPAQALLFRAEDCSVKHSFGRQDVNRIRFSPHGRFLFLGGFGNIPGNMQFWDKNKGKLMGEGRDINSPTTFEWTPDGRHFVTATLNRRMKVDNGFKVFTYFGEQEGHVKFERLWEVCIRKALPGVYQDKPQSPRLSDKRFQQERQQAQEASKPRSYVPPHLRAQGVTTTTDIMKQSREADLLHRKTAGGAAADPGGPPPGAGGNFPPGVGAKAKEQLNKNALKRAKAKKKKQEQEEKAKAEAELQAKLEAERAAEAERLKAEAAEKLLAGEPQCDVSDPSQVEKRIKKIEKTLKQIAKLKGKSELDEAMRQKLAAEAGLQKELQTLQAL
eukprot:g18530.t1